MLLAADSNYAPAARAAGGGVRARGYALDLFLFAFFLASQRTCSSLLIATTHLTRTELEEAYGREAMRVTISKLRLLGAVVLHGVDATRLLDSLRRNTQDQSRVQVSCLSLGQFPSCLGLGQLPSRLGLGQLPSCLGLA